MEIDAHPRINEKHLEKIGFESGKGGIFVGRGKTIPRIGK